MLRVVPPECPRIPETVKPPKVLNVSPPAPLVPPEKPVAEEAPLSAWRRPRVPVRTMLPVPATDPMLSPTAKVNCVPVPLRLMREESPKFVPVPKVNAAFGPTLTVPAKAALLPLVSVRVDGAAELMLSTEKRFPEIVVAEDWVF